MPGYEDKATLCKRILTMTRYGYHNMQAGTQGAYMLIWSNSAGGYWFRSYYKVFGEQKLDANQTLAFLRKKDLDVLISSKQLPRLPLDDNSFEAIYMRR